MCQQVSMIHFFINPVWTTRLEGYLSRGGREFKPKPDGWEKPLPWAQDTAESRRLVGGLP
jgi:hypothetical protein